MNCNHHQITAAETSTLIIFTSMMRISVLLLLFICAIVAVVGQESVNKPLPNAQQSISFACTEWMASLDPHRNVHHMLLQAADTSWSLVLSEFTIMRKAPVLIHGSEQSEFDMKRFRSFHIVSVNGQSCSGVLSVAQDHLMGNWKIGDETWEIIPERYTEGHGDDNQFIIRRDQWTEQNSQACGVKASVATSSIQVTQTSQPPCMILDIALAADITMVNRYGPGDKPAVFMLSILNLVQGNYDDEFNSVIEFEVSTIFVPMTAQDDPWSGIKTIDDHLDKHRSWGEAGGYGGAPYAVATAWTTRSYSAYGLAYVGSVCTPSRYSVCTDIGGSTGFLRTMQAHELGHCLNAVHDGGGNYIMAASLTNSNVWSPASRTTINQFIKNLGCVGVCSQGLAPTAQFSADQNIVCEGNVVRFKSLAERFPDQWLWEFPGGVPSTSTAENPIILYQKNGMYDVSLTVSNAFGTDRLYHNAWIEVRPMPAVDFEVNETDLRIGCMNHSRDASLWNWTFGDSTSSAEENPVHHYVRPGQYKVTLCCTNECGTVCKSQNIEVLAPLKAAFSLPSTKVCAGDVLQLKNESTGADRYRWEMPGAQVPVSTMQHPRVAYLSKGIYSVSLTAYRGIDSIRLSYKDYIQVKSAVECPKKPRGKN